MSIFSQSLTPGQMAEAGDLIKCGMSFIGKKMDEHYGVISPAVAEDIEALQYFLIVFIEHAMNPKLLKAI